MNLWSFPFIMRVSLLSVCSSVTSLFNVIKFDMQEAIRNQNLVPVNLVTDIYWIMQCSRK